MAARFIVFFSAIIVLAQGSSILPIEQEAEVEVHSGAPVPVLSHGHAPVAQPIVPLPVPVAAPHRGLGLGARPYVARPATTVVVAAPQVVVAPVAPVRQPHGVAVPVPVPVPVVVGHGNVHRNPHHG